MLTQRFNKPFGRDINTEINYLKTCRFNHQRNKVLSYVMQVSRNSSDYILTKFAETAAF